MRTVVVSYSLTGNNQAPAASIAKELAAEHVRVADDGERTIERT